MFEAYRDAIIESQYNELAERVKMDGWNDVTTERDGTTIFVQLQTKEPHGFKYLSRVDMSRYPVDPYWIGFLNPDLDRHYWKTASDSDPRFWPWSPMPGIHGSFNIVYPREIRTFWCRDCNAPFFLYHGDEYQWSPRKWPLHKVVAHLRDAITHAVPPTQWRPIQRPTLLSAATQFGVVIPSDAGLGAK